jgi:hypothetical protein
MRGKKDGREDQESARAVDGGILAAAPWESAT